MAEILTKSHARNIFYAGFPPSHKVGLQSDLSIGGSGSFV